jgi:hypothetical protein
VLSSTEVNIRWGKFTNFRLLWNLKFCCYISKSRPLDPILNQMAPSSVLPSHVAKGSKVVPRLKLLPTKTVWEFLISPTFSLPPSHYTRISCTHFANIVC